MPLHLESFVPYEKEEDVKRWIYEFLRKLDSEESNPFISEDGTKIICTFDLTNATTSQAIGKLVYTLEETGDENNPIQLLDIDITLNNDHKEEVQFINKLPKSSERNEYYDAAMSSGVGHFQLETVNRHKVNEEIEGTTREVSLSAFPFNEIEIFDNIGELNKKFQLTDDSSSVPFGFDPHFVAPSFAFGSDETFTYIIGKVIDIKDVSIDTIYTTLDNLKLITFDTGLGQLPALISTDNFQLEDLEVGKIVSFTADIKADLYC